MCADKKSHLAEWCPPWEEWVACWGLCLVPQLSAWDESVCDCNRHSSRWIWYLLVACWDCMGCSKETKPGIKIYSYLMQDCAGWMPYLFKSFMNLWHSCFGSKRALKATVLSNADLSSSLAAMLASTVYSPRLDDVIGMKCMVVSFVFLSRALPPDWSLSSFEELQACILWYAGGLASSGKCIMASTLCLQYQSNQNIDLVTAGLEAVMSMTYHFESKESLHWRSCLREWKGNPRLQFPDQWSHISIMTTTRLDALLSASSIATSIQRLCLDKSLLSGPARRLLFRIRPVSRAWAEETSPGQVRCPLQIRLASTVHLYLSKLWLRIGTSDRKEM